MRTTLTNKVAAETRMATLTTRWGVQVKVMVVGPRATDPGTYHPLA